MSRAGSSTTWTARRSPKRACAERARPTLASNSCRASCRTCPRSTPRRRSSASPPSLPLVFAPTGFTRLMNHEGEPAVARVAGRLGIPYALSTLGTTSPEDRRGGRPGHEQVVPALPLERSRRRRRPRSPRSRRRLHRARPHRRHAGRGSAAPRCPQRVHDSANAVDPDAVRHRPAPGLVVQPPDDRTPSVRRVHARRRDGCGPDQSRLRSDHHDCRPRLVA